MYKREDLLALLPDFEEVMPKKEPQSKGAVKTLRTNLSEDEQKIILPKLEKSGLTANAFLKKSLLECKIYERVNYQDLAVLVDVLCSMDNNLRALYEELSKVVKGTLLKRTKAKESAILALTDKIERLIKALEKEVTKIGNLEI